MGFPMIMPIAKGFDGSWDGARTTIEQIVSLHVNNKYERILEALGGFYKKGEIQEAFLTVIKRDFFDKGFVREELVKQRLIATNKCNFVRFSTPEEECKGIDLVWTDKEGYTYAGSVKGPKFDNTAEYRPHINKLKESLQDFHQIYIFYVDEHKKKAQGKRVK